MTHEKIKMFTNLWTNLCLLHKMAVFKREECKTFGNMLHEEFVIQNVRPLKFRKKSLLLLFLFHIGKKFCNIFSVPCGNSPQMVALMADLNASSVFNGHSRRVRNVARGLVSEWVKLALFSTTEAAYLCTHKKMMIRTSELVSSFFQWASSVAQKSAW